MAQTSKRRKAKNPYSVHPAVLMVRDWIEKLPAKTGRSLEQWIAFVRKEGPADEKARGAWLKKEHGIGSNTAGWIAQHANEEDLGIGEDDPESYLKAALVYVERMYEGPKEGLRPMYDRLLELGLSIGPEAKACPCTTIVPLYRNHVFAQIKPTTRTRIDLGLSLKGVKTPKRLIDTGGEAKKDRITHRIPIETIGDIDADVEKWLKRAYDLDE